MFKVKDIQLDKVLFLAFIIRICYVFFYPQIDIQTDALVYDDIGYNLATGKGFVSGFEGGIGGDVPVIGIGPIYPVFLSFIYLVAGHNYTAVRLVQLIINLLTIGLVYKLSEGLFNKKVALISSILCALYPAFIGYSGLLLTENLSTFLIVLFVYCFYSGIKKTGQPIWIFNGLIAGVLILLREEFILTMPIFFLLAFHLKINSSKIFAFLGVTFLVVIPWTIRNYIIFNEVILVSAHGGDTLWISSYEKEWLELRSDDPYYNELVKGLSYFERSNVLRKEGIRNIINHPLLYIKFCFKRLIRFWIGSHSNIFHGLTDSFSNYLKQGAYLRVAIKSIMLLFNTTIVLSGFFGIYSLFKNRSGIKREWLILVIPIFVIMTVHFFLFATTRYQVPIMPFMIILTSLSLGNYFAYKDSKFIQNTV